jgi:hypothetical protein
MSVRKEKTMANNYSTSVIRDTVLLDQVLADTISTQIAGKPQSNVLIAAREVTLPDSYTFELENTNLVILTDYYNPGSGGAIKLTGPEAGGTLTLFSKDFSGIRLVATGAAGRNGEDGSVGADGDDADCPVYPKKGIPGMNGGNGGDGGAGHDGFQGGNLNLFYVSGSAEASAAAVDVELTGGAGGDAGAGGVGGKGGAGCYGGKAGKSGQSGKEGKPGSKGMDGTYSARQVDSTDFWSQVSTQAPEWAAYRLRLAEYYFHAFTPAFTPNSGYLTRALDELNAVLALDPGNTEAALYKDHLLHNQNILGLRRDADILPVFDAYSGVVTGYLPLVDTLFQSANYLLGKTVDVGEVAERIQHDIDRQASEVEILKTDAKAAQVGASAATAETAASESRVEDLRAQVYAKQNEMDDKSTDIWGELVTFWTIGKAIYDLASAIVSGGASVVAFANDLVSLSASLGEKDAVAAIQDDGVRDTIKKSAGDLEDVVAWAQKGTQTVISISNMINDLGRASKDSQEYANLLVQLTEASQAQGIANLRAYQSQLAQAAAEARVASAQRDLETSRVTLRSVSVDRSYLDNVWRQLIKNSRQPLDVIIRNAFLAARAVEIYTLADLSNEIRYDYGYLHPDRDDDPPSVQLLGDYQLSRANLPGLVNYANRYVAYNSDPSQIHSVKNLKFSSKTDPGFIEAFKAKPDFTFRIALDDLPPNQFEATIENARISLKGVSAGTQSFTVILEHGGHCYYRRHNGSPTELFLSRRTATLQSPSAQAWMGPESPLPIGPQSASSSPLGSHAVSAIASSTVPIALSNQVLVTHDAVYSLGAGSALAAGSDRVSFWRRGVATDWHVYIDAYTLDSGQVDLSGLYEIEVSFGYMAFL